MALESSNYVLARSRALPYAYDMPDPMQGKTATALRVHVERILRDSSHGPERTIAALARAMHRSQQSLNGMLNRAKTNKATTLAAIARGLTEIKGYKS